MKTNSNIIHKCDFGYLKSQYKKEIIKTLICFGISIAILATGMIITGVKHPDFTFSQTKNNLLTIAAVLGLLPASRFLINVVMFAKAQKYICSDDIYNKVNAFEREGLMLRYDLYVTAYEKCFPVKVITICDNCLIGYSDFKEFDHNKFTEHVKGLLAKNGLKVETIKIFSDLNKFTDRLKSYNEKEYMQTDHDLAVLRLMENLSL